MFNYVNLIIVVNCFISLLGAFANLLCVHKFSVDKFTTKLVNLFSRFIKFENLVCSFPCLKVSFTKKYKLKFRSG